MTTFLNILVCKIGLNFYSNQLTLKITHSKDSNFFNLQKFVFLNHLTPDKIIIPLALSLIMDFIY